MVGTRVLIIGADAEPATVFAALRAMPSKRVHILASPRERGEGRALGSILEEQNVPSRLWVMHGDALEDIFATASQIISEEQETVILASGAFQTALVSAAYTHGIPALHGAAGRVRELPILPFTYATQLADAKMAILETIRDKPTQLQDVIKITRLKANAVSYHLHGTAKTPGLFSMGIASTDDKKRLTITPKGKTLIRGLDGRARK